MPHHSSALRRKHPPVNNSTSAVNLNNPPSLLDLTSIIVSLHYPFQYIEERYKNIIPEPVQKQIIYHSFPKNEQDVLVYAASDFNPERYGVEQVVQIGFHVSGVVQDNNGSSSTSKHTSKRARRSIDIHHDHNNHDHHYHNNHHNHNHNHHHLLLGSSSSAAEDANSNVFRVSATFDRGKITSVSCNCEGNNQRLFWCDHVISLALHRIRKNVHGKDFVLRVPISETLLQLNRSQLQKLVQYLISDHTDVLPTAQRLADEILFMKTDDNFINRIHGAPDPTAGPSPSDPHSWALNENQIVSTVRSYISHQPSSSSQSSSSSQNVIQVLIEKIYKMIKSRDSNSNRILQIITNEFVRAKSQQRTTLSLWDQIVRIWNVIVMNPDLTLAEKQQLTDVLEPLSSNEHLPESEDESSSSMFSLPLRALRKELEFNDFEIMRLHSSVCHGVECVRDALQLLSKLKKNSIMKMENAHLLFDILRPTHPVEAFEVALISLTNKCRLKQSAYVHEKHLKLVESMISKLAYIVADKQHSLLVRYASLLENQTNGPQEFPFILVASYLFETLGANELSYRVALKHLSVPQDSFVHSHLEATQIALATNLLLKAPIDKATEISSTIMHVVHSNTNLFRLAQETFKQATTSALLDVSFNIALHVVKATKYTVHRRRWEMVRWVVSCGVEIGVAKLFYLVRNWGEYFSPVEAVGTVASNVLGLVNNGGTVASVSAAPAGPNAQSGAIVPGAASVNSSSIAATVKVDKRVLEELGNAARNLAVQCAKNDPQNCALNTLTICESDPMAFETSYQIVLESASKEFLTPQQIFTIARYMEHRGYTQRAYRLAVIAVQHVHIGYNQDTHSLISEIHWTCNLSHQLSTPPHFQYSSSSSSSTSSSAPQPPPQVPPAPPPPPQSNLTPPTSELENLIPLLIRNIKCATVLTEILRRSITIMSSYENSFQKGSNKKLKQRVYEKLSLLIEGTIDSYITTTHSRLVHISPRHYSDFIEFLSKARENFMLAPNGVERFKHLVESMKVSYKGKKKLLFLLTERFG